MWRQLTAGIEVPVSLHLDRCRTATCISACLRKGWNSVLFDALPAAGGGERAADRRGGRRGALLRRPVEGEIEAITGVEDSIGTDEVAAAAVAAGGAEVIRATGIDVFAPAIGNAHGVYRAEPQLDAQQVSDIVAAEQIPIALHGGTGMTDAQFTDLIARGCAKVNISTALKVTFMQANLEFLRGAEERGSWDRLLFSAVRGAVLEMAADHVRRFGSVGQAG